jgi:hypothetical protein
MRVIGMGERSWQAPEHFASSLRADTPTLYLRFATMRRLHRPLLEANFVTRVGRHQFREKGKMQTCSGHYVTSSRLGCDGTVPRFA